MLGSTDAPVIALVAIALPGKQRQDDELGSRSLQRREPLDDADDDVDEQRIELQRAPLKLIESSKLVQSVLSRAAASAMASTHLGETEQNLDTHHMRLFHLLLPVNV